MLIVALTIAPLALQLSSLNEIEPCHHKSEVSSYSPLVKSSCPHIFISKVLLEQGPPVQLHIAYGGFHVTVAELSWQQSISGTQSQNYLLSSC